jgi:hypothetical protein
LEKKSLLAGWDIGVMKMQVNSSETIPAALNIHQAIGLSKPRGEGICLGAKACLGRLGAGGCKIKQLMACNA